MFYGPSRHTMRRRDSLARQHTHSVQALALAFLPGVTPLMDAVMHGQHAAVLAFMQAVRLYTTPSFDIAHLLCRVPHAKSHGIHSKTEARPAPRPPPAAVLRNSSAPRPLGGPSRLDRCQETSHTRESS